MMGMNGIRWAVIVTAAAACSAGCQGTRPALYEDPVQGLSSVIVAGRIVLPTGETPSGLMHLNIEGQQEGRDAEVYRLAILPQRTLLYQIEPGSYRVGPTRSVFGFPQAQLAIKIEGRSYKVPFPRELLRKAPFLVKPARIYPLGVLEATISSRAAGQKPLIKVRLDDSVAARREITQQVVRSMMDPRASHELRSSAISWTRALDQTLLDLLSESDRPPSYKRAP